MKYIIDLPIVSMRQYFNYCIIYGIKFNKIFLSQVSATLCLK